MNSSVDLGLPVLPGVEDKALFEELNRLYNAIKLVSSKIDTDLLTAVREAETGAEAITADMSGGKFCDFYAPAAQAIFKGAVVTIQAGAARLAHPADNNEYKTYNMTGIAMSAVAAGGYVRVRVAGVADVFSGLQVGVHYQLAMYGGGITPVSPYYGYVYGYVGWAISSTSMYIGGSLLKSNFNY